MSLLFSCICNQPERLLAALEPVQHVLRTNKVTRWGLGYVQSGEVLLSRHPRPVEGTFEFFTSLGSLASDYVIGCAASDDEYKGNTNTQPFRFKHWMMALESDIPDFAEAHQALDEILPPFLRRSIKGKSPAEYVFHIFLSLLHDAGQLDDYNLPTADTMATMRSALAMSSSVLAKVGVRGTLGNLVVCNSRSMVAARLAGPLYLRRLRQLEDPKRPDTEYRSVLVLGADTHPGEGFEELPERSFLCIGRDISTDISAI